MELGGVFYHFRTGERREQEKRSVAILQEMLRQAKTDHLREVDDRLTETLKQEILAALLSSEVTAEAWTPPESTLWVAPM